MTQYRCWLTFETDRALQLKVKSGWYTDHDQTYLPISHFPPPRDYCWPGNLKSWCKNRGIEFSQVDGLTISAKVKKHQVLDFIDYIYGDDPSYNDPAKMLMSKGKAYLAHSLVDLIAFVSQDLNPRLWYELFADEW